MDRIQELLEGNRNWVERTLRADPEFFARLRSGQSPEFLWIGCSDSRVPATEITGMQPGSIFVHRNIANVVVSTDSNLLSVVFYAVKVLRVSHVIVCGHYGCGGIQRALDGTQHGFIDNWLVHIKDVYHMHRAELDAIQEGTKREMRLAELNVVEQVRNIAKISFLQEEWQTRPFPSLHGWIYNVEDGLIRDLDVEIRRQEQIEPVYRFS